MPKQLRKMDGKWWTGQNPQKFHRKHPPGRTGTLPSPCLEHSLKRWSQNHSSANSLPPYRWVCGLPEREHQHQHQHFCGIKMLIQMWGLPLATTQLFSFESSIQAIQGPRKVVDGPGTSPTHWIVVGAQLCSEDMGSNAPTQKTWEELTLNTVLEDKKTDPNWTYYDCMCPCNVKSMFSNSKASKMNLQRMHYDPNLWPKLC